MRMFVIFIIFLPSSAYTNTSLSLIREGERKRQTDGEAKNAIFPGIAIWLLCGSWHRLGHIDSSVNIWALGKSIGYRISPPAEWGWGV